MAILGAAFLLKVLERPPCKICVHMLSVMCGHVLICAVLCAPMVCCAMHHCQTFHECLLRRGVPRGA